MEREKLRKISMNLTADRNDYMSAFRKNIDLYVADKDITLREIAEKADIPYSTLNTFLYGTSNDCKLSTAVKLARAFGVTIDELVGAETMEPETRECVSMSRALKEHHRYVNRLFVKHQYLMHGDVPETSKQISMLLPECNHGHLKTTNILEPILIDHLRPTVKSEACLALKIPCDHYEPYYFQNEILVLGAHRLGLDGERCVISKNGNMYICMKKIEEINGVKKIKYLSLIDRHNVLFTSDEIDDRVGYVIGFLHPDGEWGIR